MSSNTVRFAAEFDSTGLEQGLNRAKSSISSLSTNIEPITLFGPEVLQDLDKLETSTNALEQSVGGLDSASTGLSGTFEEIGNAASQTGDTFNTLGTSGETVEQQLAAIGTTSSTAGQSMEALGGSVDTTGGSMGALNSAFEETTGTSATLMQGLDDSTKSFTGLGDEAEGTGSKIKDIFSKGGGIAVGISATISGIANLVRGFRDYDDAQNKVAKASLALTKAQGKAKDAQANYNQAVAEFGVNSGQAKEALDKLGVANDNLEIKQTNLSIATKRAGDSQIDIWLGLAGTVTGIGGSIVQTLDAIGGEKGLAGLAGKMSGFVGKVKGFGSALIAAAPWFFNPATAAIAGGLLLGYHILDQSAKVFPAFASQGIKLTSAVDDINLHFAELDKVMEVTGKGRAEILEFPAEAAKAYLAMGGPVTESGKIVVDTTKMMEEGSKTGFQQIGEQIQKSIGLWGILNPAVEKSATVVSEAASTWQAYVPILNNATTSTRGLYREGQYLEETYTTTTKAINFAGLEQQKQTGIINANYEAWKQLQQGVSDTTPAIEKAGNTVASNTDVYTAWINKGVDPANEIIKELSKSVQNGVIPQEDIGKAVELAAAQMEASGKVTEANKEQVIQLATAHLKTKPAIDAAAKALEKYKAEQADAKRINDEYTKALEDNTQKYIDVTKEAHEYDDMLAILNSVTGQHIMLNDKNIESMQGLASALKASRTEYKKQEEAIGVLLDKHGLLTTALEQKIMDEKDDRNELNQLVISTVDWTDALDGQVGGLDLVASGTAKAVMEMDEFVKSAVEGEAKTKALNEMYAELGRTMVGDLHTTVPLTTKDFIELGKSFKDGVPLAEKLAKIVEEDLSPAFETFSEVIQAATRKDFKEAWKGLELGDVGKKFKGELKDILAGMNDIARSGKAVATVISGLVVGALKGMSDKALGQGIKEITEQFNRFKSLDPDASLVQPLINFVNALPTKDKAAGILAVHQGLEDMATAQATGNITTEQAKKIMGEYTPMIEAYNKAIAAGKSPTDALAIATGQIGAAAETTAGQYDPLQTNILKTATAYDTLVNGIAKTVVAFPVPDISPFTTAILTIATGWDTVVAGIQGAKVTIPALIIDKFTKSIDSAYAVFNKMMVGIIQAKYNLAAPNIKPATDAFKSVEVNWSGYANKIAHIIPKITVNNSQALNAIKAVQNAMNSIKNVSRTITITTVYRTVGTKATNTRVGANTNTHAFNNRGGEGATGIPITALESGTRDIAMNQTVGAGGGQTGDVNITIMNRDEFGTEKVRKFKAKLGKDRYLFGTTGAGG